jgi:hypothetical protein|nr:MAG TPA: nucelotide kinase [Caudoviricetes sp.]
MANENSALQNQVGGDHYKKLKIQPMVYAYENKLDPLQFSVVKYVTRFRDKAGEQDLNKAKHCIDMLIELEYGTKNKNKSVLVATINPMSKRPNEKEKVVLIKTDGEICTGYYCEGRWWVCEARFACDTVTSRVIEYQESAFDGWYYAKKK